MFVSVLAKRELGNGNPRTLYIDRLQEMALGNRNFLLFKLFDSTSDPKARGFHQHPIVSTVRFYLAQLLEHKYLSDWDLDFYRCFYRRCIDADFTVQTTGWELTLGLMSCFNDATFHKPENNRLVDMLGVLYSEFIVFQISYDIHLAKIHWGGYI